MIARIWHGWTTAENAGAYDRELREKILPGIRARQIRGLREIQLFRRSLETEVEFMTVIWFDSLEAVRAFAGEDYETAVMQPEDLLWLKRYDARSQHYEVRERMESAD